MTRIVDFGAFVAIGGGKEGLVHISQIADKRVEKVTDYLQMGQEVPVKVLEVDRQGRIRLSIKEATEQSQPAAAPEAGIYLTQAGNFDAAYEAFDSVLELDPTYNYAHLNRGIALYYGGRDKLAQDDLLAFYQDDPNDPFRSLWLYLAEQKLDEKQAKEVLKQHFEKSDKEQWGWNIVEFYLGNISEQTLMERLKADATDNTSLAEHLSETNFYLGKYYLSLGDLDSATALFKLAVANNVHNFVEHRYALLELSLLGQDQDDLAESDQQ